MVLQTVLAYGKYSQAPSIRPGRGAPTPGSMIALAPRLRLAAAGLCVLLAAVPAAWAAEISYFQGKVEYLKTGTQSWAEVSGSFRPVLGPGDQVRTGRASKAVILFEDSTKVTLGPLSNFALAKQDGSGTSISLPIGKLRAQVQKQLGGKIFDVRTPSAVCAVRGTDFAVMAGDDGSTRVEVYDGLVAAAGRAGEVLVRPGEFSDIALGGAPMPPRPNPNPPASMESAVRETRDLAKREVYREISKESVLAQAQQELQSAEYQNRKVAIDASGVRLRMEEYVTRPTADSFKYVVLNTREDRFDFGKILFLFNKDLPTDLTLATKTMLSATGSTAPEWQLSELSSVMSNTTDKVVEDATGGHMVADNPSSPARWDLFFANYGFYAGDANSTENGGKGKQLWSFTDDGDNIPQAGEFAYLGGKAPTRSPTEYGSDFHTLLKNTYGDGTWITAEDFVTFNDGTVANPSNLAKVSLGTAADRLNFERVYTSSLFGDRKIDLVFSAKLLKDAGLLRLSDE